MEHTDYKIGASAQPSAASTTCNFALPKELSNRVPAEVWQLIAVCIVVPYSVSVNEDDHQQKVSLSANKADDITNVHIVSKDFNDGVRSGFRNGFSGHISFGYWHRATLRLINTILAQRITSSYLQIQAFRCNSGKPFEDLNKAILCRMYPNLRRLAFICFSLGYLDGQECLDGMHKDEILQEAEEVKDSIIGAGMNGLDEMDSFPVGIIFRVGTPRKIAAIVELPGQLKFIGVSERTNPIYESDQSMTYSQFIRLSARNEDEASSALELYSRERPMPPPMQARSPW